MCIQSYGNDKYLVAHEERGQTSGLYTCIQIVRRRNNIIQLKQAKVTKSLGMDLCSDTNLHLDGWLIIDTNSVMNQREDCSLNGGFNMQVYDKSSFDGVCDEYLGETRLESECLPGEGLNFYFRREACVPGGLYMDVSQRTYCLANWDDEVFNFILLKHERQNHLWVFRYPRGTRRGNNFKALLMKDLYSSTETSISETSNYLILSVGNQSPKMLNSLCFDDYEICSKLEDPCSYSDDVARACARTCGYCTETRPALCHLDGSIVDGIWTDANHAEEGPHLNINVTSIRIAGSETLHCIDWSNRKGSSAKLDHDLMQIDSDHVEEKMLVTVSDNGCRPRFTCAKFTRLPRVFFMQLSQTRLWPLVLGREDPYNCSNFVYTTNKDIDKNPYRKRLSTLFTPTKVSGVSCDLSRFVHFDVRFKGGTFCSGTVVQSSSKKTVQFHLSNCPASILTQTTFTCVEYANLPPQGDFLLVTKTNGTTPKTHCWLFPEKPNNVFHMVASEDCNGAMKRKIRKGRLHPIATFTRNESLMITESTTSQEGLFSTTEQTESSSETYTDNISSSDLFDVTSLLPISESMELPRTTATTTKVDGRMSTTKSVIYTHSQTVTTHSKPSATNVNKNLLEYITTDTFNSQSTTSSAGRQSTFVSVQKDVEKTTDVYYYTTEPWHDKGIVKATGAFMEVITSDKPSELYTGLKVENTTYLKGNSSVERDDDYSHPSPAVAAAIVLTFIAFQVSVICKCSC